MAVMVTPTEAMEDPAALAEAAVLGTIAIPGRGEQVRVARAFVAGVLRELAAPDAAVLDNATLLTSELVTNAIRHSRSGESGGSVGLVVLAVTGGIRVEVTDSGSAGGSPVVQDDIYTCDGLSHHRRRHHRVVRPGPLRLTAARSPGRTAAGLPLLAQPHRHVHR
jgi:anti-sigma regulatory factor (Ser/Thr protein kinase)